MKKAFRKSLKRQATLGYFGSSFRTQDSSAGPRSEFGNPILWRALTRKYQFNYPNDWYRIEAHWLDQIESFQEQPIDCPGRDGKMNNAIIRVTQCNESYQLCNNLPRSFIVPKDLKDFTLINSMSTIIKDHRVPVISYCCPIEYKRNFIIRCASSDQIDKVIDILSKIVKPLKIIDLTSRSPSLESIESAHKKLRLVCRPGEENSPNFMAKSGKWLNIVSQALKIVNETAKTLLHEASVVLIENDDRGWNNIVSSLVQLLLEPHCRTIQGLESLISKEWIYLAGGQLDTTKPDVLFTLFLDCIYQIYLQNTTRFEYTSEYLRYLFESQHICLPVHNLTNQGRGPQISRMVVSQSSYNENLGVGVNNGMDYKIGSTYNSRTNGHPTRNKVNADCPDNHDIITTEIASYKPSSISMVDLNYSLNDNNNSVDEPDHTHEIDQLERGYNILMYSPFYEPENDSPTIEVYDHIVNMRLWSSLYLRWQSKINFGCLTETLYYQLNPPKVHLRLLDDITQQR